MNSLKDSLKAFLRDWLSCVRFTKLTELFYSNIIWKILSIKGVAVIMCWTSFYANCVCVVCFSGHSINKVVWCRGRLQCDGNGAAWSQSGGPFQLLLQEVQLKDCPAFGRPDGMTQNFMLIQCGGIWKRVVLLLPSLRIPLSNKSVCVKEFRDAVFMIPLGHVHDVLDCLYKLYINIAHDSPKGSLRTVEVLVSTTIVHPVYLILASSGLVITFPISIPS